MLSTNLGSAPLSLSMSLEEHTHGIHIDTDWGEKVLFCCCIHTIYSFMVMICSSFFVMLMILMVSRHYGSQPQIHLKCQELAMFSTTQQHCTYTVPVVLLRAFGYNALWVIRRTYLGIFWALFLSALGY